MVIARDWLALEMRVSSARLRWLLIATAIFTAATQACIAAPRPAACDGYLTVAGDNHPLACRIFAADGSEVALTAFGDRVSAAALLLLGEVHDNPDHHRLRANLIGVWGAPSGPARETASPPPAIVMEHIRSDQETALASYAEAIAAHGQGGELHGAVDRTFSDLAWQKSGWPPAELFRPLLTAAHKGRHPLFAGDPPRASARALARTGMDAIDTSERERLGLGFPLAEDLNDGLLSELEASHCGLMPKTAFGSMADAQRFKDAHQAAALLQAAGRHGRAVLLAGNGHVRADRGVPWHIRRMAPGRAMTTVLFLEVDDTKIDARTYIERGPGGAPISDFVVMTPRVARPDPCEEMRKRFKR